MGDDLPVSDRLASSDAPPPATEPPESGPAQG